MRRGCGLTTKAVVFDSWAWWEVLDGTATGEKLAKRYIEAPEARVLTVDLSLAEIAAKLARDGREVDVRPALAGMDAASEVVPISVAATEAAGPLLQVLRRADRNAGLADAVILAVAREAGATLISGDPCFRGQRDVTST